ncbi:hypothetical protein [Dapis sp. BLCC M229]
MWVSRWGYHRFEACGEDKLATAVSGICVKQEASSKIHATMYG